MAKNPIIYLCFILTCCIGSSCVHKTGIKEDTSTDTPPEEAINLVKKDTIVPVKEVLPDTTVKINYIIVTDTVKDRVIAKLDSVKTVTVIAPTNINYNGIVQKIYTSFIGVREKTGNNDGPQVEMFLKSVGLGKGNPWCAAFVHYCLEKAGVKTTITGYSPTCFIKSKAVWADRRLISEPKSGDVGTLYFPSKGRIAHTFFYDKRINNSVYESVEGNTNDAGSREGDGVYRKKRSYNATYGITKFID